MSDDLTSDLDGVAMTLDILAHDAGEHAAAGIYREEAAAVREARDEIARLRAERTRMTGDMGTDLRMVYSYELGRDTTLAEIAALDASSTVEHVTYAVPQPDGSTTHYKVRRAPFTDPEMTPDPTSTVSPITHRVHPRCHECGSDDLEDVGAWRTCMTCHASWMIDPDRLIKDPAPSTDEVEPTCGGPDVCCDDLCRGEDEGVCGLPSLRMLGLDQPDDDYPDDETCPDCGDNGDCGETAAECGNEFHGQGEH